MFTWMATTLKFITIKTRQEKTFRQSVVAETLDLNAQKPLLTPYLTCGTPVISI